MVMVSWVSARALQLVLTTAMSQTSSTAMATAHSGVANAELLPLAKAVAKATRKIKTLCHAVE